MLCNEDDIAAEVQRITGGRGAYGAIDAVAGDLTARMVAAVRPKGTLLIYGVMDGMTATLNLMEMLFKSKVLPSQCTLGQGAQRGAQPSS